MVGEKRRLAPVTSFIPVGAGSLEEVARGRFTPGPTLKKVICTEKLVTHLRPTGQSQRMPGAFQKTERKNGPLSSVFNRYASLTN